MSLTNHKKVIFLILILGVIFSCYIRILDHRVTSGFEKRISCMNEFGQLLQGYYTEHNRYPSRLEIMIPVESLNAMQAMFEGGVQYESSGDSFKLFERHPGRTGLFERNTLAISNKSPIINSRSQTK
jgi:hypothetical protein